MAPEVWYDTETYEVDVYMHSAGVLRVYFADGETVHSVNNMTFDLNYDGDIIYSHHNNGRLYAVQKDYFNNYDNIVIESVLQEIRNPYLSEK